MNNNILKYGWIILIILSASCKVEFTRTLRKQIEAKGLDLKKIQYYNSKPIMLKRDLSSAETKVTSGEGITEKGQSIEIIEIKKNTPGVCDKIFDDRMHIKFEIGNDRYLIFEEHLYTGFYQMKADKWDRSKALSGVNPSELSSFESFRGVVNYDGKTYYTNNYIIKPRLLIKKKESVKTVTKRRQAKGVIVE